jgi:hypothetical protein
VWVCFLRLLAIVLAVFMLRSANWARWLLVAVHDEIERGVESAQDDVVSEPRLP